MAQRQEMEEIDLREIFNVLKRQVRVLIILPLIALLTSGVISFFVIQPIYQAQTTLIVNMAVTSGDNVGNMNNSLRLSRELVPTYKELVSSKNIKEKVEAAISKETGVNEFTSVASVQAVGNTEIMRITVEDKDPKMATLYANVLAQIFAQEIPNIMSIDNVKIIDQAIVPDAPVKPNKTLNLAIGGVLGLMLAIALIFLREFLDNTYKRAEDVKRELDLPVLGIIPNHNKQA